MGTDFELYVKGNRIEMNDFVANVVSDVLLAVIQHIHRFEFRESDRDFHLWVVAIFRNRIRDHVRKGAGRVRVVHSLSLGDHANRGQHSTSTRSSV